MLFQKVIGPDMFSWIWPYVVEVCAIPSALLVNLVIQGLSRTNWLDFGEDLDPDPTTRIFLSDSSSLRNRANSLYIAQYLKKLWTDLDETWWTGWVFDHDKLIRIWWRSESGSGYENNLIFKVILHHWKIGPKTMLYCIAWYFKNVLGPICSRGSGIVWQRNSLYRVPF